MIDGIIQDGILMLNGRLFSLDTKAALDYTEHDSFPPNISENNGGVAHDGA